MNFVAFIARETAGCQLAEEYLIVFFLKCSSQFLRDIVALNVVSLNSWGRYVFM